MNKLMSDIKVTNEMEDILSRIDNKENLFITGKAGSGKTTFLRLLTEQYDGKVVVTAPTGIAAINAGGMTIHSMFGIDIGVQEPKEKFKRRLSEEKKAILKTAEILIIDEISMVRCDLIDAIDKRLKQVKRCKKPFGGMQLLMFGDMMQLPPVVRQDEGNVLSEYYDDFYFFNAHVFKQCVFRMVELTEIFRQKDERFISLLNNIRNGKLDSSDIINIDKMYSRNSNNEKTIHLCALKSVAESYNRQRLGAPTHIIHATLDGDFNAKNAICDLELHLREGARVMITCNDITNHDYYNGTLGFVRSINPELITVLTDEGKVVGLKPETTESYKYELKVTEDEEGFPKTVVSKEVTGRCTQFPLTLAYAITIHKSQGLTFDDVYLHIREIFQSGQLYTALSRCRIMDNVSLDSKINDSMLIKNNAVKNFLDFVHLNNGIYGNLLM